MEFNKKILIIDDEQNVRNSIRRMINENLSFVEVLDIGEDDKILSVIEKSRPDLILLDILMPNINGLQVLKTLRENENREIKLIPVIILSGVSNREIEAKAKIMGVVDYIVKPFNEKVFLMKIKNYLK